MSEELCDAGKIGPDQKLWISVLKQAVEDLHSPKKKISRAEKRWFCEKQKPGVNCRHSFISICENLGLDPDMVRALAFKNKGAVC